LTVFNYAKKEVHIKIVYYGPGLSGKTTNLQAIHEGIKPEFKGKLVSLATQTDRTLFFDFMPLELGSLGGFRIRLHLYTVPGQVHYNATRKLVLKGVDGVVFVADSQKAMKDANIESFMNLEKNLQSYGKALKVTPHVIQANKRDLDDVMTLEEINSLINRHSATLTEAVAAEAEGVLETLTEIVRIVMKNLKDSFAVHRGESLEKEEAAPFSRELVESDKQGDPEPEPVMEPEPESALEPESEPVLEMELEEPGMETVVEPDSDDLEPAIDEIPLDKESEALPFQEGVDTPYEPACTGGDAVTVEPICVRIPVDGVGTVELAISVKVRVFPGTDEKVLEIDVENNSPRDDQVGRSIQDTETVPDRQPATPEDITQDQDLDMLPETNKKQFKESMPPLAEITGEPLGAPLDGQSDEMEDLEELPAVDGGKVHDDNKNKSAVDKDTSPEPSQQYDPTTNHVDLFEDEKNLPEEPEAKKKGVLGLFKKK
jgi:signal recognition particle receptor subunit beta